MRRFAIVPAAWAALAAAAAAQGAAVVDLVADPDQTVLAGEAFRAPLFGGVREQPARDRRSVWAWDLGFANSPGLDDGDTLPLVSVYVWQHPDDGHLLRALLHGVQNELFYAQAIGAGDLEWVASLDTSNYPGESGEWIDGEVDDREKLVWGYARPGLGLGWRRRVGPQQDNLFAVDVLAEAGALWFGRGDSTGGAFALPDSTFEGRLHGKLRFDLLDRNLVELPHAGVAAGADAIVGRRARWRDWGDPAIAAHAGHAGREFAMLTGYAFGVTGVPGVDGGRHRLVGAVHAGLGDGVDRFSAVRIGGGPDTRGGEFELTAQPVLPGAALGEFFVSDYALAYGGYRFEPVFFAFVDVGVTTGVLDRDRARAGGRERRSDAMTALSARLSTGFFGSTRLQLIAAYDFDAVRHGDRGGFAVALQVSGYF